MGSKINVAIIGFGVMGKIRYDYLKSMNGIKLIEIFDPENLKVPKKYIKNDQVDDLIKSKEIDAVFICTPNYLNAKLTKLFLLNGKHVFCEKPPAMNLDQMNEVLSVQKKSNKKLMYGFNHRHHDSIKMMHKLIFSKKYGKILWMRGRYGKSVDKNFLNNWRSSNKKSGGGILLDQGIHMLDLFIHFAGDFDEVKSYVSNLYWELDIEDNVFAIYKNNENQIVASLHSTMTQWRHLFSIEVFLEGGYMVLNGLKTNSGTYGKEKLSIAQNRSAAPAATWENEEHHTYKINNSWKSEVSHFISAIKQDTKIEIGNINDAIKLMKLIDMTYENSID